MQNSNYQGKNLDQDMIDNPPVKNHSATYITDSLIIGDITLAYKEDQFI